MDERHMKPVILIFALTTLLSACASRTGTDAAIGGALGGGTGLLLGGTTGAVAGGLLGAGAGALLGQVSEGDSTHGNHHGHRKGHDDD
jgi:osmotically inducible lipoprotein OsmB